MKKLLYTSVFFFGLTSCTTFFTNKNNILKNKANYIDFCKLKDSVFHLPKYDYSKYKATTKIFNVPMRSMIDSNEIKKWKEKGYRVIIISPRSSNPYFDDSTKNFAYKAQDFFHVILKEKLKDSMAKVTGKIPTDAELNTVFLKRITQKCEDF